METDDYFIHGLNCSNASVYLLNISCALVNATDDAYGEIDELLWSKVLIGLVLSVIVFGSLLGNLLVVLSIATNKRLRTITNYFVASLATADLCVSVLVMPLAVILELLEGEWIFHKYVCAFWISSDVMLCTASILNLCCISLDRYFAITNPLKYATTRSKRLALIMIAVVWVASVLISCPPFFGWIEIDWWSITHECTLTASKGYRIFSSMGSFFIPLIIMVFVYIRIFQVAREREKRLKPYRRNFFNRSSRSTSKDVKGIHTEMSSSDEIRTSDDNDDRDIQRTLPGTATAVSREKCEIQLKHLKQGLVLSSSMAMQNIVKSKSTRDTKRHLCSCAQKNNNRNGAPVCDNISPNHHLLLSRKDEKRKERAALLKEHKAAKTLAVVVGLFIFCWFPFFINYTVEAFCEGCYQSVRLTSFLTWLGYFNSLCNPFIYAFYSQEFRRSFWNLTIGVCYKNQATQRNGGMCC